jgi:hypothetical protein
MSDPTAADRPVIDPNLGLRFAAARHLIPIFQGGPVDRDLAMRMAHSAVDAYNPQSRSDCVNAARTVAFSMAALALLSRVAREQMPLPEELRAFGRATALNNSADQSERTMMLRRGTQKPKPPASQPAKQAQPRPPEPPVRESRAPETHVPETHVPETHVPETHVDEAEIEAIVAEAMKDIRAGATAAPRPAAAGNQVQPTPANLEAAIRAGVPVFDAAASRGASLKKDLLRNTAIERVGAQNAARRTG